MKRPYIKLFFDYNDAIQELSDEQAGKLIKALLNHANYSYNVGLPNEIEDIQVRMFFKFLVYDIDKLHKQIGWDAERKFCEYDPKE